MSVQLFNSCGYAVSPHTIHIMLTNSLNLRQASIFFFSFFLKPLMFLLRHSKKIFKTEVKSLFRKYYHAEKDASLTEELPPIIAWDELSSSFLKQYKHY